LPWGFRGYGKRIDAINDKRYADRDIVIDYAVEFTEKTATTDRYSKALKVESYQRLLADSEQLSKYDAVLLPYSMGSVLDSRGLRTEMLMHIRGAVKPGGRIWGLFFDPDAVKRAAMLGQYAGSADIETFYEVPDHGCEGALVTRVGGKMFVDYRFTAANVLGCIGAHDYFDILHARPYINDNPIPGFLGRQKLDPMLEPVRIMEWRPVYLPPPIEPQALALGWNSLRPSGHRREEMALFVGIQENKGRPFMPKDLFYLVPDRIYVTPKADGRQAVLAFDHDTNGFLHMRGDDQVYTVAWKGPPEYVFQVELIGDPYNPDRVVLTDVLRGPEAKSYLIRMRRGHAALETWGIPITYPKTTVLTTAINYPTDVDYPYDGYVLNWDDAPAKLLSDGVGAARYLKFVYTYDRKDTDGIVREYELGGNPRMVDGLHVVRYDKTRGTPVDEIMAMTKAWTPDEFRERITLMSLRPQSLNAKLDDGPQGGTFDFTLSELLYLWAPWNCMDFTAAVNHKWQEYGAAAIRRGKLEGLSKYLDAVRDCEEQQAKFATHVVDVGGLTNEVASEAITSLFGDLDIEPFEDESDFYPVNPLKRLHIDDEEETVDGRSASDASWGEKEN
jgi:hypothetical protein